MLIAYLAILIIVMGIVGYALLACDQREWDQLHDTWNYGADDSVLSATTDADSRA